jgi:hypothetical protein
MNPWVEHVKAFAKEHQLSYGCAISNPQCSASYKAKQPKHKKEKYQQQLKEHHKEEEEFDEELAKATSLTTKIHYGKILMKLAREQNIPHADEIIKKFRDGKISIFTFMKHVEKYLPSDFKVEDIKLKNKRDAEEKEKREAEEKKKRMAEKHMPPEIGKMIQDFARPTKSINFKEKVMKLNFIIHDALGLFENGKVSKSFKTKVNELADDYRNLTFSHLSEKEYDRLVEKYGDDLEEQLLYFLAHDFDIKHDYNERTEESEYKPYGNKTPAKWYKEQLKQLDDLEKEK